MPVQIHLLQDVEAGELLAPLVLVEGGQHAGPGLADRLSYNVGSCLLAAVQDGPVLLLHLPVRPARGGQVIQLLSELGHEDRLQLSVNAHHLNTHWLFCKLHLTLNTM